MLSKILYQIIMTSQIIPIIVPNVIHKQKCKHKTQNVIDLVK